MINIHEIKQNANALFSSIPFAYGIENEEQYSDALSMMDQLIDEYDSYKPLIEFLSHAIEDWEDTSDEFTEFNQRIASLDNSTAVLRTLMDQYQLSGSDLQEEVGGKSLISMILNGKRKLTVEHIKALYKRFGISPQVFIN
jgi:HTH-type transcriptional regulator/antitoxin HigA